MKKDNRKFSLICILLLLSCLVMAEDFIEFKQTEEIQYKGDIIFDEMVLAMGDIASIKNIQTKGITNQPLAHGILSFPVEVTAIFPDKFKIKFQEKEFIIDKDKGWLKYSQGYYENLPESYVKTILGNLERNLIRIAKNKEEYEIIFMGEEHVLNRNCQRLLLKKDGTEMILLIDTEKHLPLQMLYENKSAKTLLERTYLEYRKVNDVMFPVHTVSYDDKAQLVSEIILEEIEFNIVIDKDEF
jgi:hypothetical protein